jgi:hypothetical protein
MRMKFFACLLVGIVFTSGAFAAVVVEKRSRQMPYVEVVDCHGVHSFIFRGPKGIDRPPILVPPREYWAGQEAGIYSFVLRYQGGNVCSRLVTPEVFARYRVGDDFYASAEYSNERTQTEDSKTAPSATHHRQHTAQTRKHRHRSHSLAKHQTKHRSHRIASR